jgi:hypothetical protein
MKPIIVEPPSSSSEGPSSSSTPNYSSTSARHPQNANDNNAASNYLSPRSVVPPPSRLVRTFDEEEVQTGSPSSLDASTNRLVRNTSNSSLVNASISISNSLSRTKEWIQSCSNSVGSAVSGVLGTSASSPNNNKKRGGSSKGKDLESGALLLSESDEDEESMNLLPSPASGSGVTQHNVAAGNVRDVDRLSSSPLSPRHHGEPVLAVSVASSVTSEETVKQTGPKPRPLMELLKDRKIALNIAFYAFISAIYIQ